MPGNDDVQPWEDPFDDNIDDTVNHSDQLSMRYVTNNYATVGSVLVADNGQVFVAGMYGMTCQLDASMSFLNDTDVEDGDDTVEDGDDGGSIVLVRSDVGNLDLVDLSGGWGYATLQSWMITGLADAAMWDGGTVALRQSADDCLVDFLDDSWAGYAGAGTCGEMALDDFGTAWVTIDGELFSVASGEGAVSHGAADLVVADAVLDSVYVADGNQLNALSKDGDLLWSTDAPGQVVDLATMGTDAWVVALVDQDRVMVFDGATGDQLMDETMPSSATLIEASRDANVLAIARGWDGLHIFEIVDD